MPHKVLKQSTKIAVVCHANHTTFSVIHQSLLPLVWGHVFLSSAFFTGSGDAQSTKSSHKLSQLSGLRCCGLHALGETFQSQMGEKETLEYNLNTYLLDFDSLVAHWKQMFLPPGLIFIISRHDLP